MRNINLKKVRVEMNISQAELAKLIKVSRQTIGLIEAGKYNPSLNLCLEICWATDKSLDELFWRDKNE